MDVSFVYITASDKHEALKIGRTLVEERLAACANVFDGMTSLYWWEGEVQQGNEAVLIAKTKQSLLGPLIERVRELHSYSCPCVISWPAGAGHGAYLQWIRDESR